MPQHDAHVFDYALEQVSIERNLEVLRETLLNEGLIIGEPWAYDPYRDMNEVDMIGAWDE